MPEFGPFSLVTLAFLMFSFVAWELGISHKGRLSLAFFAGVLLVVSSGRLLLGHLTMLWVRLFFVGGPISLSGGGEAGGNWIRQGVVRSGRGSGGRRYCCRQRPMGDFRWPSRAS